MSWNKPSSKPQLPPKTSAPSLRRGILAGLAVIVLGVGTSVWFFSNGEATSSSLQKNKPSFIKETTPAPAPKVELTKEKLSVTNVETKVATDIKKYAEPKPRKAPRGSMRTQEENYRPGKRTTPLFRHTLECDLATFAIPGEPAPPVPLSPNIEEEIDSILNSPIEIEDTDTPEEIETKKIVAGMKEEMREYLRDGGTVQGFFDELQKRQDREVEYVSEARAAIYESLKRDKDPVLAIELWKKSNEFLQSKGICTVPLPRRLERYCEREGLDLTTVGAGSDGKTSN